MKKLMILGILFALAVPMSGYCTKPAVTTVGTNSVKLVAAKPLAGVNAWGSGTYYKQGTVVVNVQRYYMAIADGTSGGTPPVHTSGEVTDGVVTWRFIDKAVRSGVIVTLESDGKVNWSLSNYAAEQGKGISTAGIGSGFEFGDEYQGAIYAISADTNIVTIGIQEW